MRILLLSDGLPGHANQAKGLIFHIQQHFGSQKLVIEEQIHPLRHHWMRPLLKLLLNFSSSISRKLVYFAYGFAQLSSSYDLIVSAGGNSSFLNAQLANDLETKNVFIGSLRGLKASLFKTIITLESIHSKNNIIMPFAISSTTFSSTKAAAEKYFGSANDVKVWAMIIGGKGANCDYSENDWRTLAEAMTNLSQKYQIKWLVTTSRRTGLKHERILKNLIPEKILLEAVWYNHEPKKVMNAYLGKAHNIFCTVDSMAMLSESISSGTGTTALVPEKNDISERYQNALNLLQQKKLLKQISINQLLQEDSLLDAKNEDEIEEKIDHYYKKLIEQLIDKNILTH